MRTWAISQPRSEGANVVLRTRLVINDVPDEVDGEKVLDWLDDYDPRLDYATPEHQWSARQQLTAQDAPNVRWTGGS